MLIQCDPDKGGCGNLFPAYKEECCSQKFLECPGCGRFIKNPFYVESNVESNYIG